MYTKISNLKDHKKWWDMNIIQDEYGSKDFYALDIWDTGDTSHGIRIELKKEDMQTIADMLNIAINHNL